MLRGGVYPQVEPIVAEIPYLSDAFEKITWLGISSTSDAKTVFYIDNLKLGTPDDPALHFGTSGFSIELWVCPTMLKIDSKDARRRFMSKDHYPNTWWNLNVTTDGKPFLEMVDANKAGCGNRPTGTIPENAWTHLAVVVDRASAKTKYYFNGKLDSVQDIPPAFTGALDVEGGDLSIGSSWQPFVGLLDEVKIYNRVLTEREIEASYEKEKGNRTDAAYQLVE